MTDQLLHEEYRERVARAIDPDAFDESKPRSIHPMAQLQWGARRIQALEAGDNLLSSGLLPTRAAMRAEVARELAAEQRRMAEDARTSNGQAEAEDFADWLEDRAKAMEGGEGDAAGQRVVTDGEQGLGTCSPSATHPVEPAPVVTDEAVAKPYDSRIVADFIAQREEYVRVLRQCVDADADYHRWQGHAEARRQLADKLKAAEGAAASLLGTRPQPTREQIASVLRDHTWIPAESRCSCGDEHIEFVSHHQAEAVLALLKGGES